MYGPPHLMIAKKTWQTYRTMRFCFSTDTRIIAASGIKALRVAAP
jgi:hypothetical protein